MKQTFEIPDGCNRVTIEQQGNKIVTTFEPEFKDGDVVCFDIISSYIGMYRDEKNYHFVVDESTHSFQYVNRKLPNEKKHRHATESEKQQLWYALAKVGKQWNAEKKCIEDLKPKRWRAEEGCVYYYAMPYKGCLGYCCDAIDYRSGQDNKRYEAGNYFKTKAKANSAGLKMKELLKQINP